MSGNSFGKIFQITTFGESHGPALGVVVDGCPAGLTIDVDKIAFELSRRRPGQSKVVSQRVEDEEFEILSGVFEGQTTGSPIAIVVRNKDARSKDYDAIKDVFRPGHADYSYMAKYGLRDYRGGGRASARETIGRVIGGAIAKQILSTRSISIRAGVVQVGNLHVEKYVWQEVERNELRCVDPDIVSQMQELLNKVRNEKDSVGGIVEVQAQNVPAGLGEPVFDKLDALIAGALMSIPAVKGVEIGAGFEVAKQRGSQVNDLMTSNGFLTNNHGGILGGISSGAPIIAKVAFKPTPSLPKAQKTVNLNFDATEVTTLGRHDPCVAIRAVPIVEAMLALVLVDCLLIDEAALSLREGFSPLVRKQYGLANE